MPRDKRLWMTFPIDFWMHPKVAPLPVEAKWAFVEMNGYSRMQDLDGRIPEVMALRMWGADLLQPLITSDPDRPLVLHEGDEYVIRDYAEHQDTKAAREQRTETNTENGRKGGRPRKNRTETDSVSGSNREETEPKAETETESDTPPKGGGARKRGTRIPDQFIVTTSMRAWAAQQAPLVDVDRCTLMFVNYWRAKSGAGATKVDWEATWQNWLIRDNDDKSNRKMTPTERAMQTAAAGRAVAGQQITSLTPKGIEQ